MKNILIIMLLLSLKLLAFNTLKTEDFIKTLESKNNYSALAYLQGFLDTNDRKNYCIKKNESIDSIAISIIIYGKFNKLRPPLAKDFISNSLQYMYKCKN